VTTPEYPWPVHPAADLFPLLDDNELAGLADDISINGLHEPAWLYDDPDLGLVLLDGRNRVRACALAEIEVDTRTYTGDDPVTFVVSANLKRRHLTKGQRDMLAVDLIPLFAEQANRRMLAGKAVDPSASWHQGSDPEDRKSTEQAAQVTGTSGRSVARAKHVAEESPELAEKVKTGVVSTSAADAAVRRAAEIADQHPDLADQLRSGKIDTKRAERIIRDREAEAKRVAEAQALAATGAVVARVDLRHGDFREVLADVRDVDAIIPDPPYPAEFLPLLDDLAAWADMALTPVGVLVVLFGQTHLPEVYRRLSGHRPYRWTGAYLTPGNGYVSMARHVQSNWKPILVYGGGPRFADVVRSEGSDAGAKSMHMWGQDHGAFHTLVERFTKPGQTVADPFMGSGTTLLAAWSQGRHVIGADIDAAHVATTRERLDLADEAAS